MSISDKQLASLITKAADPAEFSTVPGDKVLVSRQAFQTLLDDLKVARERAGEVTTWMDVATEMADELLVLAPFNTMSQAQEDSPLGKFHKLAVGVENDDEPY